MIRPLIVTPGSLVTTQSLPATPTTIELSDYHHRYLQPSAQRQAARSHCQHGQQRHHLVIARIVGNATTRRDHEVGRQEPARATRGHERRRGGHGSRTGERDRDGSHTRPLRARLRAIQRRQVEAALPARHARRRSRSDSGSSARPPGPLIGCGFRSRNTAGTTTRNDSRINIHAVVVREHRRLPHHLTVEQRVARASAPASSELPCAIEPATAPAYALLERRVAGEDVRRRDRRGDTATCLVR